MTYRDPCIAFIVCQRGPHSVDNRVVCYHVAHSQLKCIASCNLICIVKNQSMTLKIYMR